MKRNLSQPTSAPQQKDSNQKPQISSDASELPDGELNRVTGGVVVTKRMDASSPGLWTDSLAGPLSTTK